jgi:hypothetical protein
MALTCAEATSTLKVGHTKIINEDRLLIRFTLMNMGPVASCCEHNDALSVYMDYEEFLVSKERLCPHRVNFGLYFMKRCYQ